MLGIKEEIENIFIESDDTGLVDFYIENFSNSLNYEKNIEKKIIVDTIPRGKSFTKPSVSTIKPSKNESNIPKANNEQIIEHEKKPKSVSLLTYELSKVSFISPIDKILSDFAIHDNAGDDNSKTVSVIFWRIFNHINNCPQITVVANPKITITEFIGLCFWKLNTLHPDLLKDYYCTLNIDDFDIKIMLSSIDDGPDSDFPPLNRSDIIGKYDFKFLAITKSHLSQNLCNNQVSVDIYSSRGINRMLCSTENTILDVLERIVDQLQLREYFKCYSYNFKLFDSLKNQLLGNYLNKNAKLKDLMNLENLEKLELGLVRTSSRLILPSDKDQVIYQSDPIYNVDEIYSAIQNRVYELSLLYNNLIPIDCALEVTEKSVLIKSRGLLNGKFSSSTYSIKIIDLISCQLGGVNIKIDKNLTKRTRIRLKFYKNTERVVKSIVLLASTKMKAIELKDQLEVLIWHNKEASKFL